jgi:GNAT superfamily N-acetyltransferase
MALPDGFALRRASASDLDVLVAHRRAMFRDMGYSDDYALDAMAEKFQVWLQERMDDGLYLAWLVSAPDGTIAAGAGLWLMDWPPHMVGHGIHRGNILNVYTEAPFRRQGLARALMEAALAWCRENGVDTVILHASAEGKALYESIGFTPTNEMRRQL